MWIIYPGDASTVRHMNGALQMEGYPKFHNEVGLPIVCIGCRELRHPDQIIKSEHGETDRGHLSYSGPTRYTGTKTF